ncbi:ATP-binding protein [Hydrogenophaga sp. RWCD_12]|uniref:ATP-binding protein n=1 Tax=Hydrogenophaga sp. RWCD_12 TaxID=3391190 RepID=UPI00398561A6
MSLAALRERLRRIDTLFLRLFLLMWVTLVISNLVAFSVASPFGTSWMGRLSTEGAAALPPLPSLPPDGLVDMPHGPPAKPGHDHRPNLAGWPAPDGRSSDGVRDSDGWPVMPARSLWLDYLLRALLIGVGAAIGARWLSAPMRRLALASGTLSQGLAEGRDPPALDERLGTVEVRDSAHAFNTMARALKHQFEQHGLHMAAVSHDLRTPLTRLRLRLEQLPPETAQAAAQDIRAMDELIDASLAVVREQATAMPPALMDLGAMLQSLTDDRAELGQPVSLADRLEGAAPLRVCARPASLRRIVGNLVDNALRYGHCARLSAQEGEGGVVVSVEDEGPGIAPGQLQRVMQPWVRLQAEGAPGEPDGRPTGSGLGLAIALDLAQREGGRLSLENRAEGGLRARLWLPLA